MERLTVEEVRQIKTEWDSPYMGKPNDFWENRIKGLFDTIEAQQREIDRLQRWVKDLQSGMYINCVYCGHRYGMEKDTPVVMADVLKEHVEHCPKHPMSKLKQEIEELKDQNDILSTTVNMFAPYIIGKKESEVVEELKELLTLKQQNAVLTADNDEQAVNLMRYDTALKCLHDLLEEHEPNWYLRKHHNIATDALLGGAEDESK